MPCNRFRHRAGHEAGIPTLRLQLPLVGDTQVRYIGSSTLDGRKENQRRIDIVLTRLALARRGRATSCYSAGQAKRTMTDATSLTTERTPNNCLLYPTTRLHSLNFINAVFYQLGHSTRRAAIALSNISALMLRPQRVYKLNLIEQSSARQHSRCWLSAPGTLCCRYSSES